MTATESKWTERVAEWKASGRSAPEYSRGRGFAASTLLWWSSRLGHGVPGGEVETRVTAAPHVRMARVVRVAGPRAESLTVRVGAAGIEVQAGFDRLLLRQVVDALGGAS